MSRNAPKLRVPGKSDIAYGGYVQPASAGGDAFNLPDTVSGQGFITANKRKVIKSRPDEYRKYFDAIDLDHNGHLTVTELQAALELAGYNFSLPTVAHIIRIHDRDMSGTISFDEFRQLHDFFNSMRRSYDKHDTDDDGELNYDETYAALKHAGYQYRRQTLQGVFQRFNPTGTGRLGLEEFLALNLFIRSSEATFTTFDPMSTGQVHMNIDQFIYATANTQ